MIPRRLLALGLLLVPLMIQSQEKVDHGGHGTHQMAVEPGGVVMNENHDTLPRDCVEISRDHQITIHAGRNYGGDEPGVIFAMSQPEVRVEPCSRVQLTFINEDDVRHQWMVHGLPRYLYPAGMFHIEASGGHSKTGTFIVPGDNQTYLIHCDMAQHMEMGMRGQLVVGKGSGDLWGVPGVSDSFYRHSYLPGYTLLLVVLLLVCSFAVATWLLSEQ
jgi:plastocyanin